MRSPPTIDAVIPCFNESSTVASVITACINSQCFNKIITVDDASTDQSPSVLQTYSSQIQLIKHNQNLGKFAAVLTAIKNSKADLVFLLDADLINLTPQLLSQSIDAFNRHPIDMLIIPFKSGLLDFLTRKVHWNEIQSGQRILRRHHFLKLKKYHRARFALETILNQQAILHQWKTQVFYPPQPLIPITPSKLKKHGLLKGLAEEVRMCREIILFTSLSDHIRQCQYILHPPKLPR
ncbi:hypothetical protein A3H89_00365 [Candidatus Amesbacteria bacterium RIFCSPLOWO2_02_FULL_48_11]|uniref:Glycosyltransferase 2-like domain-containing protein n=2 Tax=Candidatus Amesiibacteriota TaxID=1752730 RepID=A0A1F4ZF69_9BACT|nr:MAG: hypothetical protein UY33_C0042G0006 [Candidatus Amesbacteria bacterium GW2011_GWA1_48_9]OGC89998.1 MAG: hypothetical protein A2V48_01150 [Candidatus Amesbacteria bacterium RBG_19FT_COMBO_48_16]OGC96204.1 MAG: hypothetical protein A3C34_02360 [Candidatus Amesbacteria bacterium RIFCSPHIGHO2_02_FULL_48_21]OGC96926.1 MAG: hypothetical protein A2W16_00245 [Candidatus Amesbacteria bacterium RBG_16_48_31]OGD00044.1 MAG: hypothetical protein A2702_01630 [Candidatus Amesbacteria bacterium RIFCS